MGIDGVYRAVDETNQTYDSHYLNGNFYLFNAAVAGSATDKMSTDASALTSSMTSICPKGWRLPTSGNLGSGTGTEISHTAFKSQKYSFYDLVAAYGFSNELGYNWNNGVPQLDPHGKMNEAPLYFTVTGQVANNMVNYPGIGRYFSGTMDVTVTKAYMLNVTTTVVRPAYLHNRNLGLPIRCVAQ